MNVKRHYQTKHANSHFLSESNHAEKPFTESVYQRLCYEICEWKVHLFCSGLNTPNHHNNTNGCIIKYKMVFFKKKQKKQTPTVFMFRKRNEWLLAPEWFSINKSGTLEKKSGYPWYKPWQHDFPNFNLYWHHILIL